MTIVCESYKNVVEPFNVIVDGRCHIYLPISEERSKMFYIVTDGQDVFQDGPCKS